MTHLTEQQRAEVRVMSAQGETVERIAKHFGVDPADLPEQPTAETKPAARRGRGKAKERAEENTTPPHVVVGETVPTPADVANATVTPAAEVEEPKGEGE